jgi:hypothetical protein
MRNLILIAALIAPASSQTIHLTITPGASSSTLSADFGLALPGTLQGNYEATTNPLGTKTLPGLFGGIPTDNVPIATDVGLGASTLLTGFPHGEFNLEIAGPAVTITGLGIDLIGETGGSMDLTLGLLFDTFRTFDPISLYFGGFPIELPIGSVDLSVASLVQLAPGVGVLEGDPSGVMTLNMVLPMGLSLEADFLGTPIVLGPIPLLLPLSATLEQQGDLTVLDGGLSLAFDEFLDDPLPGVTLDDLEFPLPTILPPGSVANLLFNLAFGSLSAAGSLDLVVHAEGGAACEVASYCSAEPNSSGFAAVLDTTGSLSISAGDLGFVISDLPMAQFGMVLFSPLTDSIPQFGGGVGTLCLGAGPLAFHQNVLYSRGVGQVAFTPNWSALPGGTVIQSGDTMNFQYWYRDYPGGGNTNLSTPLSVTFCP